MYSHARSIIDRICRVTCSALAGDILKTPASASTSTRSATPRASGPRTEWSAITPPAFDPCGPGAPRPPPGPPASAPGCPGHRPARTHRTASTPRSNEPPAGTARSPSASPEAVTASSVNSPTGRTSSRRTAPIRPRVDDDPMPVCIAVASAAYARRAANRSKPGASSNRPARTRRSICCHTGASPSSLNQPALCLQWIVSRRHADRMIRIA